MDSPRSSHCPNCRSGALDSLYALDDIPVHSTINVPSREAAMEYPTGNLRLGYCRRCGFLSNSAFDSSPQKYSPQCEESQHVSPTFNKFARDLAQRWIDQYQLRNKTILEIGCGKGEFLELLCELGDNRGIGIDPTCQPQRTAPTGRIRFISELYGEQHSNLEADCVLCRHTLEHIWQTADFIEGIRRVIGDRKQTLVLFELPDVTRILAESAFWDIYYEHCSYFSPGSLARLFRAAHFDLLELRRDYGDQYILLAAKPADGVTAPVLEIEDDLGKMSSLVDHFRGTVNDELTRWREFILSAHAKGERVVLWSALSKAVSFLTTLKVGDAIEYAVDISPYRQGWFLPGTGQQIMAPAFLARYQPHHVILMNPIYVPEVKQELVRVGCGAQVVAVGA